MRGCEDDKSIEADLYAQWIEWKSFILVDKFRSLWKMKWKIFLLLCPWKLSVLISCLLQIEHPTNAERSTLRLVQIVSMKDLEFIFNLKNPIVYLFLINWRAKISTWRVISNEKHYHDYHYGKEDRPRKFFFFFHRTIGHFIRPHQV